MVKMNKKTFGSFLLGLILLMGCAQQPMRYVCPDGTTVSDASLCPKQDTRSDIPCNFNDDCPTNKVCQKIAGGGGRCVDFGTGDICGDEKCSNMELKQGNCKKDCG